MSAESDLIEAIADSAEATQSLADAYRDGAKSGAPVVNVSPPSVHVAAPVIHLPKEDRPRKYRIAITSRDHEGRWKTAEIEAI